MVRNMEPFVKISNNPVKELIKNKLKKIIFLNSCNKSNHIIAVSNFVKNTLVDKYKINNNKVSRVYHAGAVPLNDNELENINLGINDFIFTAGSIRPARGLEDIIIALGLVNKINKTIPHLLIAGDCIKMSSYKKKLIKLSKKYKIKDKIIWLGKINQNKMGWCYRNAISTIITSRVESFCFIAHEALCYGSTIISSNRKCLPEILGDAAIYYESLNSKELSIKIIDLLKISTQKKNSKSLIQAKNFNNIRNFEETMKVFQKVNSASSK